MKNSLSLASALPVDAADALLVGRVWVEGTGPVLVLATPDSVFDLSSVARLAGPLALMLAVQTLFCALYASWVVFRMLKRDYEAAIMSAAFCGFGLGATATAIANMQALTRRHGPAPQAFIVVPVTGAFLVDILNVIVLTSLISLPFVGGM